MKARASKKSAKTPVASPKARGKEKATAKDAGTIAAAKTKAPAKAAGTKATGRVYAPVKVTGTKPAAKTKASAKTAVSKTKRKSRASKKSAQAPAVLRLNRLQAIANSNPNSRSLIARGKEQGYLTYAEVNDHLPNDIVDPEQIEDIVNMINDMGITVHEKAPDAESLVLSDAAVNDDEAVEEASGGARNSGQ